MMCKASRVLSAILLLCTLSGLVVSAAAEPQPPPLSAVPSLAPPERDPSVLFIENSGQFAEGARFQVWGGKHIVWLAADAIWITLLEGPHPQTLSRTQERGEPRSSFLERKIEEAQALRGVNLRLSFPGANPHPRLEPFNRLDTCVSYFIGNDAENWRPDVPVWGGVRYVELYPGVDLQVSNENGQIVQRVVAHGATEVSAVRLRVEGAEEVAVDGQRLRLHTAVGDLTLPLLALDGVAPGAAATAFGPAPGVCEVSAPFASTPPAPDHAAHAAGLSDLAYGTFLGGSGVDAGFAIAVDASGAAYVAGITTSPDFPTTPGAFETTHNARTDTFVAKLNPAGSGLVYATFLGGLDWDNGEAIHVDASGAAYVAGYTRSSDFPCTAGAFDTTYHGDWDAFVAKVDPTGSQLTYATLLGGSGSDASHAISVDVSGAAYVVGSTGSDDFPTTPAAFDTTYNGGYYDAFVAKLTADGSGLAYATLLGGSDWDEGHAIAVDASGAAYVAGGTGSSDFPTTPSAFDSTFDGDAEAFVARLNPDGGALAYATFLGGSHWDSGEAIAVDASGAAYVAGDTKSSDFPTTPAAFNTLHNGDNDAFVARLDPTGSALVYATYLGGSDGDYSVALAVNASGAAYVAGRTNSSDFPATPAAFDSAFNPGHFDAFVARLNPAGSALAYATFLGGSDQDYSEAIAVDASGAAYVTGWSFSSDFPTTPAAFDPTFNGGSYDGFVAKLATNGAPALGAVTPSNGSGLAGAMATFTTTWSDVDGWQDLEECYFHIGASPSISGNVTLLYNAVEGTLWLCSDDGTTCSGGHAPGSASVLENGQAIVHCEQTSVQMAGDSLSVTWAIEFKPGYCGTKKLGLKAKDVSTARAKGAWKGTWTIVQGDLTITQMHYWGPDEYVEVTNQGADAQDLTGWQIQSVHGQQWYAFPAGYMLAAGGHVRVRSGPDAWSSFPTNLKWTADYMWNDQGDEARLYDACGGLVDSWSY